MRINYLGKIYFLENKKVLIIYILFIYVIFTDTLINILFKLNKLNMKSNFMNLKKLVERKRFLSVEHSYFA